MKTPKDIDPEYESMQADLIPTAEEFDDVVERIEAARRAKGRDAE